VSQSPTLLPGATIGIFGGGQLGRLTAMAARTMGYRIHVLDPDPGCPARFVVDQCVEAGWDDTREAARLARGCDVVTLEIEQISLASMNAAGSFAPVRPSEGMLGIIQDRIEQKNWLARNGFPVGPFRAVRSLDELREAIIALGGKCFCKSATGGYDGRGQGKVGFKADPSTQGCHSERSEESPHLSLSGHESGCPTSLRDVGEAPPQQSARHSDPQRSEGSESPYLPSSAAANHPETSLRIAKPTPRAPHFDRALAVPGVRLHLYEKLRPRKGRKMGHLSAVAATPEEAVALVLKAKSLL
jgi:phosphoribosylaminoimidazole carboxylase (NCAIR synthetase)